MKRRCGVEVDMLVFYHTHTESDSYLLRVEEIWDLGGLPGIFWI